MTAGAKRYEASAGHRANVPAVEGEQLIRVDELQFFWRGELIGVGAGGGCAVRGAAPA